MNTKHTPGPWYFEADKGIKGHWTVWSDVGSVKTFVADCYQGDEAKTDAQLIAAAPEMSAALWRAEDAVAQLCIGQDPANECWNVLAQIRAALSKAQVQS